MDTNPTSNSTLEAHGAVPDRLPACSGATSPAPWGFFVFLPHNSELDAVEFAISRQALIDAGWNAGCRLAELSGLHHQALPNSPLGAGDIGGRNDVRDTIYDDHVA